MQNAAMATQLSELMGSATNTKNAAPTAKSTAFAGPDWSLKRSATPAQHEIQTITLIPNVFNRASAHPTPLTASIILEDSPFTHPRMSKPPKNSRRLRPPAIGATARPPPQCVEPGITTFSSAIQPPCLEG